MKEKNTWRVTKSDTKPNYLDIRNKKTWSDLLSASLSIPVAERENKGKDKRGIVVVPWSSGRKKWFISWEIVYIVQSIFQESTLKLRKKKSYDGLSFCLSVAQLTTCDVQCWGGEGQLPLCCCRAETYRARQCTKQAIACSCFQHLLFQWSLIKSLLGNADFVVPEKSLKCSFPMSYVLSFTKQYIFGWGIE